MRGSVRGTVVGAENEYPIAGLIVLGRQPGVPGGWRPRSPISTRSDRAGGFAFDDLSSGEWVFTSEGVAGEVLGRAVVQVFDNALCDVTIAVRGMAVAPPVPDVYLEPVTDVPSPCAPAAPVPGSVHGRVVQDNGHAFPGATISVVSGEGSEPDVLPVSDADGAFTVDGLAEGEWLLRAIGPNGETGTAICHVFDNALSEVTIEIVIPQRPQRPPRRRPNQGPSTPSERGMRGNLRGRVLSKDDGQPIADATITVVSGAGAAPDIAPLSNASGLFSLDGLPVGRWTFRAIAPDGQSGEASVTITADALANVIIYIAADRK